MKVMSVSSDDSVRDAGDPDRADSSRLIVTIDGPAGTGKSSVARMVATRVGLTVLDTGAMYRAAALLTLRLKIDPKDGVQIAEAIGVHRIEMDFDVEPANVLLDGDDPGDEIRGSEVESIVSVVAAHPEVRQRLVAVQRAIATSHSRLVTEGRDQGSVVFPDADARFFLTASSGVRAKRRVNQLRAMGRGGRSGVGASGDRGAGPHRCRSRRRPPDSTARSDRDRDGLSDARRGRRSPRGNRENRGGGSRLGRRVVRRVSIRTTRPGSAGGRGRSGGTSASR